MGKIIEQVGPSRQLFEAVNFAFMKIFDFFSQNSHFWDIPPIFWRFPSRVTFQIKCLNGPVMHDANLPKKEKCPKNGYFD